MSAPPSESAPAWERVNARPHVVVISDDADLRDFLTQGLLLAGFWTSAIASGIQAIEVFRLRRFDLIMVDAHIRGLPAIEIVRRLRGRSDRVTSGLTAVPIVIVNAGSDRQVREAYVQAGVDDMLDPPLDIEDVAVRLMTRVAAWREAHPEEPWADASVPQSRGPVGDSGAG